MGGDLSLCNFDDKVGGTTPVGRYSPQGDSPYGCADMAGNVWEWCRTQYRPYPYRAGDGREDPRAYDRRVVRGGSFIYDKGDVRCAVRHRSNPNHWDWYVEFRVVAPEPDARLLLRDDMGSSVASSQYSDSRVLMAAVIYRARKELEGTVANTEGKRVSNNL